jgi:hypothetical protein
VSERPEVVSGDGQAQSAYDQCHADSVAALRAHRGPYFLVLGKDAGLEVTLNVLAKTHSGAELEWTLAFLDGVARAVEATGREFFGGDAA